MQVKEAVVGEQNQFLAAIITVCPTCKHESRIAARQPGYTVTRKTHCVSVTSHPYTRTSLPKSLLARKLYTSPSPCFTTPTKERAKESISKKIKCISLSHLDSLSLSPSISVSVRPFPQHLLPRIHLPCLFIWRVTIALTCSFPSRRREGQRVSSWPRR